MSLKCVPSPELAFSSLLLKWLRWSLVGKLKAHAYIASVAKSKIGTIEK